MLQIWGGGNNSIPTPMLTEEQIMQAMANANVQSVRISEVISWYKDNNQTFSTEHLNDLLIFCKTNNLPIFWTEWKKESFPLIQNLTRGYENLLTVSFSTNSGDSQPIDGFLYLNNNFQHWGASVQAWYWETYHNETLLNMPASLILEHYFSAEGLGAQIIQFEPYWYFFDNGTANENLKLLFTSPNRFTDILVSVYTFVLKIESIFCPLFSSLQPYVG